MVIDLSDRESSAIIEACRQGDPDAFRALYEVYKDKVYSIALYFFHGDQAAASDATQQVFLKLLRNIGKFSGDSEFSTWLYRLVVNTCMDSSRRARARRAEPLESATRVPGNAAQQDDAVLARQTAQSIQSALSDLPAKFRIAVLLRYFEDLSYAEMADSLGCSLGTVASRLNRAHKMLAGKLERLRR